MNMASFIVLYNVNKWWCIHLKNIVAYVAVASPTFIEFMQIMITIRFLLLKNQQRIPINISGQKLDPKETQWIRYIHFLDNNNEYTLETNRDEIIKEGKDLNIHAQNWMKRCIV